MKTPDKLSEAPDHKEIVDLARKLEGLIREGINQHERTVGNYEIHIPDNVSDSWSDGKGGVWKGSYFVVRAYRKGKSEEKDLIDISLEEKNGKIEVHCLVNGYSSVGELGRHTLSTEPNARHLPLADNPRLFKIVKNILNSSIEMLEKEKSGPIAGKIAGFRHRFGL